MRKTKKVSTSSQNLKLARIFLVLVATLVIVSLVIKAITLAKTSKFDGSHRFTIAVSLPTQKEILSFAPDARSLSMVTLPKSQQMHTVGSFLEIPVDGTIVDEQSKPSEMDVGSQLLFFLLSFRKLKTNLTFLDLVRLWYFTQTISAASSYTKNISSGSLDQNEKDKIMASLFVDNAVVSEKASIHIVNSTDVPGLGNRLARLVTNMGGNVVAVSTSDTTREKSVVLFLGQSSYTSKKISNVLGVQEEKSTESGISDITVMIGKDHSSPLVF